MSFVFISYQRNSESFARELKGRILDRGMLAFLDQDDIALGVDWKPAIDRALKECWTVLVIVTPDALKSQYVTYEWSYAKGIEKIVIPIIQKFPTPPDEMHPRLNDINFIDFTKPDASTWEKLLKSLEAIQKQEHIPPEIMQERGNLYVADDRVRRQAIEFLLKHGSKDIIRNIFKEAVQSNSPDISGDAGIALAMLSNNTDEDAIPGLVNAVKRQDTQDSALKRLPIFNSDAAIVGLVQCLNDAENGVVRVKVMKALAQINIRSVIPELAKLLHLPDISIPMEVIQALGDLQDRRVIPDLSYYLQHGTRNFVERKTAIDALVRIGHSDGIESIYAHFKKHVTGTSADDHNTCSHAIGSIRDIGGEKALIVLQEANAQNDRHYKYYSMDIGNALRQVQQSLIQGNKQ